MKTRWTSLLLAVCALGLLAGAGHMHARLLTARATYHLGQTEPLENAPPLVVFSTVALGGFSGILSDILWVRAAQLQMDGQYMELVQLAEWITRLQPRFAEGWIYHAWNLSYNVSVMFQRPEDRWRWVRHGIGLLRDGGLRYNPQHPTLHRELGWLFQNKIGGGLDQAHLHYKYAWALEMDRLFEGRAPDYDEWERLPATRAAILRQPGVAELVDQLRDAGIDPFTYHWPSDAQWPTFMAIIESQPAGRLLLTHMRLRMLQDHYRLDPARMRRIEGEFGKLDWRLPQAHAIYWAWSGRPFASGFDATMLDRMIFQSMSDAFRQGRLVYSPDGVFTPAPNPDILPYVMRAYQESVDTYQDDAMRTAHLNFLNHALTVLYTYNRQADARLVFDEIKQKYPSALTHEDLERYVIELFVDRIDELGREDALSFIEGTFYQSYFWLALGENERATGYDRLGRRIWTAYMEPRLLNADLRERTGLPPVDTIRQMALQQVRETLTHHSAQERLSRVNADQP